MTTICGCNDEWRRRTLKMVIADGRFVMAMDVGDNEQRRPTVEVMKDDRQRW
ncbi:hypothetical protein LOK49_LG03G02627 [Camellia lanceoleosa]|uniref:Uncharacterized protein n=1 Tax=Camellia lanceoleosa TaxID=1840588 RepID=A0ACC0IF93_9ERIC|nr:hypothetical protein LOK49_LG03G02627 [Camellia lanceoleosa]